MQDVRMKDQVARHENAGQENAGHENARHKTLLANGSEMRLMFKLQPSLLNRILNDIGQYYNVQNTHVVNLKNVLHFHVLHFQRPLLWSASAYAVEYCTGTVHCGLPTSIIRSGSRHDLRIPRSQLSRNRSRSFTAFGPAI